MPAETKFREPVRQKDLLHYLRNYGEYNYSPYVQLTSANVVESVGACDLHKCDVPANDRFQGGFVAVKRIRILLHPEDTTNTISKIARHIKTYLAIDHPNCVNLVGFALEGGRYASLISPWYENVSILVYLQNNRSADIASLFKGAATGLEYLHLKNIVHSGLKACNIVISQNGTAALSDIGLTDLLSSIPAATGMKSTVRWMSFELINSGRFSKESDVWAFGMAMFEVLAKERPYSWCTNDVQVMKEISNGILPKKPKRSLLDADLEDQLWRLCQESWEFLPNKRPTSGDIARSLRAMKRGGSSSLKHNASGKKVYSRSPSAPPRSQAVPPRSKTAALSTRETSTPGIPPLPSFSLFRRTKVVPEEPISQEIWLRRRMSNIVQSVSDMLISSTRKSCQMTYCGSCLFQDRKFSSSSRPHCFSSAMECEKKIVADLFRLLDDNEKSYTHKVTMTIAVEYLEYIFAHAFLYHREAFDKIESRTASYSDFSSLVKKHIQWVRFPTIQLEIQ